MPLSLDALLPDGESAKVDWSDDPAALVSRSDERGALYAAIAITNNLALARALLDAGADPHDSQSLYHATERWDTDALDLLAAHGIRANELSYCLFHKIDFTDLPGIRWKSSGRYYCPRRRPGTAEPHAASRLGLDA